MNYKEQLIQEEEYNFPYHYIPQIGYQYYIDSFRWSYSKEYISVLEFIKDYVKNFDTIVEVGCGDGRIIGDIKRCHPEKSCYGVDYSEKALSWAKLLNKGVDFQCINICTSNNFNLKADCILLIEVLEHIPVNICREFVNALAKIQPSGTKLLLTVPHLNVPVGRKHFQHFDKEKLLELFGGVYSMCEFHYLHSRGSWFKFLDWLLSNSFYTVIHKKLLFNYFQYWNKNNFFSKEESATRIFVVFQKL